MEHPAGIEPCKAFALLRGNGQPWLFVVQADKIAASPGMLRDLMRWTVYGDAPPRPLPPRPSTHPRMAMYRGHRSMQDELARGMGMPAQMSASRELDELWTARRRSPDEIASEVAKLSREEQENFLRLFVGVPFPPEDATLRAMLDALDAEAEPDGRDDESMIDALMVSPVGQFLFRVCCGPLVSVTSTPSIACSGSTSTLWKIRSSPAWCPLVVRGVDRTRRRRIIRIEFQLRPEKIKGLGVDSLDQLDDRLPRIWSYCTQNRLRVAEDASVHHTQPQLRSWWPVVQNGFPRASSDHS